MKIAISGAVSTGKTTLGSALAEDLGLPFIGENLERMFGPGTPARRPPDVAAATLLECLNEKRAIELSHEGFVVDRSPIDILNFWFALGLAKHPQMQSVYALCESYMDYDAVVLLPWGVLQLQQVADPATANRRNLNVWVQLQGSVTIAGLAHHFVDADRIVSVPRRIVEHQERLRFVKAHINETQRVRPSVQR